MARRDQRWQVWIAIVGGLSVIPCLMGFAASTTPLLALLAAGAANFFNGWFHPPS